MLPRDPFILLSLANTKLRDGCFDLDALCDALNADRAELVKRLADAGFVYDHDTNQFKPA